MKNKKKYPSKASEWSRGMKTIPDYKHSSKPAVLFEFPNLHTSPHLQEKHKTRICVHYVCLELVVTTSHLHLRCNTKFALGKGVFNKILLPSDNNKISWHCLCYSLKNRFRASVLDAETNSRTKFGAWKVRRLTAHFNKYSLDIIIVSLIESYECYKVIYCIYRSILLNMIGECK